MELTPLNETVAKSIQQFDTALPPGTLWVMVVSETASGLTTHLVCNTSDDIAIQMVDKSLKAFRDPTCVFPRPREIITETIVRFDATLPDGTLWVITVMDRASGSHINIARNVSDTRAIEMLDDAMMTLRTGGPELRCRGN